MLLHIYNKISYYNIHFINTLAAEFFFTKLWIFS